MRASITWPIIITSAIIRASTTNGLLRSPSTTSKAGQSCAEIVSVGCCATITERRRDARRCFSTIRPSFVRTPQRWDIRVIRNFMLGIGPISSLYDFLTFAILLWGFHASEALFHTGWFVESLDTQTLALFVIRTAGTPWRSRPSLPLTATTVLIVL